MAMRASYAGCLDVRKKPLVLRFIYLFYLPVWMIKAAQEGKMEMLPLMNINPQVKRANQQPIPQPAPQPMQVDTPAVRIPQKR
jgi:hypothetical protein